MNKYNYLIGIPIVGLCYYLILHDTYDKSIKNNKVFLWLSLNGLLTIVLTIFLKVWIKN